MRKPSTASRTWAASGVGPADLFSPDNEDVRIRWAETFGVSPENPFALLAHMGRDCAGGATFVPHGDSARSSEVVAVDDARIASRLRAIKSEPSEWTVAGDRWSLAGAQSKFTLTHLPDGTWAEVTGDLPSSHIVKPGVAEYREQALVEHVSMTVARSVGLSAAKTDYREFAGEPALVVTRFDRRRARDGSLVRVHQEDLCQALAVYPRNKYEANRGPSSARIARVLRDNSTVGEDDVWQFARALVFNYLIGAPDAHAKNYSIVLAPGRVRLAPLYDVASALPYDATGDSEIDLAAMAIGGRRRFGTVHGRHWDTMAEAMGIDAERLREEIRRQAAAIPATFSHELDEFNATELRKRLVPRLDQLCKATVGQLQD